MALEERIAALDRLVEAKMEAGRLAVEKAELKIDERFRSHNEFREQIREERLTFITRTEVESSRREHGITMRWVIGLIVTIAVAVIGLYVKR